MMPLSIKIFAGSASQHFGAKVATAFGQQLGNLAMGSYIRYSKNLFRTPEWY